MLLLTIEAQTRRELYPSSEAALNAAKEFLSKGWSAELWVRHSILSVGPIAQEKSDAQKEIEAKLEEAKNIQPVAPSEFTPE